MAAAYVPLTPFDANKTHSEKERYLLDSLKVWRNF